MMITKLTILGCAVGLWVGPVLAAPTLDKVRAAHTLTCGVLAVPEDWNKTDLHGPLTALDTEICKAIAVATLGSAAHVELRPYHSELEAEEALHKSNTDVVVGVTPDATSMWHWQISFGPPIFYDGQGFLIRKDASAASIAELAHLNICVIEGTDNEKILLARTVARGIPINPMPFQEEGEMDDGLAVRHCDGISAYVSRLAQVRAMYPKQIGDDRVLPDLLTLSPVAPAYRQGDPQWAMIVDWTIYALLQAEASGVTQANVATERKSEDPVVQRLLGVDWATSRALGLTAHDWAAQVIAVVGNYGEIYDRTVGSQSPLKLPRRLNALWTQGGLMHPLPVQ